MSEIEGRDEMKLCLAIERIVDAQKLIKKPHVLVLLKRAINLINSGIDGYDSYLGEEDLEDLRKIMEGEDENTIYIDLTKLPCTTAKLQRGRGSKLLRILRRNKTCKSTKNQQ